MLARIVAADSVRLTANAGAGVRLLHSSGAVLRPVVEARDAHKTQTCVFKYNTTGFTVNANFLVGSVILFPKQSFLWRVRTWEGITPESLAIFDLVTPRPEIVVLGLGDSVQRLPNDVHGFFRDRGIMLEIADTRIACQQFNHLSDGLWRNVAAALIPPTRLEVPRHVARRVGQE